MADEVEEADQQALMLKLNVNAAVSFSRCSNYPRVVTLCKDVSGDSSGDSRGDLSGDFSGDFR